MLKECTRTLVNKTLYF